MAIKVFKGRDQKRRAREYIRKEKEKKEKSSSNSRTATRRTSGGGGSSSKNRYYYDTTKNVLTDTQTGAQVKTNNLTTGIQRLQAGENDQKQPKSSSSSTQIDKALTGDQRRQAINELDKQYREQGLSFAERQKRLNDAQKDGLRRVGNTYSSVNIDTGTIKIAGYTQQERNLRTKIKRGEATAGDILDANPQYNKETGLPLTPRNTTNLANRAYSNEVNRVNIKNKQIAKENKRIRAENEKIRQEISEEYDLNFKDPQTAYRASLFTPRPQPPQKKTPSFGNIVKQPPQKQSNLFSRTIDGFSYSSRVARGDRTLEERKRDTLNTVKEVENTKQLFSPVTNIIKDVGLTSVRAVDTFFLSTTPTTAAFADYTKSTLGVNEKTLTTQEFISAPETKTTAAASVITTLSFVPVVGTATTAAVSGYFIGTGVRQAQEDIQKSGSVSPATTGQLLFAGAGSLLGAKQSFRVANNARTTQSFNTNLKNQLVTKDSLAQYKQLVQQNKQLSPNVKVKDVVGVRGVQAVAKSGAQVSNQAELQFLLGKTREINTLTQQPPQFVQLRGQTTTQTIFNRGRYSPNTGTNFKGISTGQQLTTPNGFQTTRSVNIKGTSKSLFKQLETGFLSSTANGLKTGQTTRTSNAIKITRTSFATTANPSQAGYTQQSLFVGKLSSYTPRQGSFFNQQRGTTPARPQKLTFQPAEPRQVSGVKRAELSGRQVETFPLEPFGTGKRLTVWTTPTFKGAQTFDIFTPSNVQVGGLGSKLSDYRTVELTLNEDGTTTIKGRGKKQNPFTQSQEPTIKEGDVVTSGGQGQAQVLKTETVKESQQQAQKTKQKSKTAQQTQQKQKTRTVTEEMQLFKQPQRTKTVFVFDSMTGQVTAESIIQAQRQKQAQKMKQKTKTAQKSVFLFDTTTKSNQAQQQKQAQKLGTPQALQQTFRNPTPTPNKTRTVQKPKNQQPTQQVPKLDLSTKPPRPRPPQKIPRVLLPFSFKFGESDQARQQKGYNVFVKVRGKFQQINDRALTMDNAKGLGAFFTDTTASATFKITKSIYSANRTPARTPRGNLENFYLNKKGEFIEKRSKRINTKGEKKEITLKGLWVQAKGKRWF